MCEVVARMEAELILGWLHSALVASGGSMFRRPRGWRKETKKQVSRIYDISPNCSQKSTQKEGKRVATSELNIWTYDVTTMKLFQTKRLFRTKVASSI